MKTMSGFIWTVGENASTKTHWWGCGLACLEVLLDTCKNLQQTLAATKRVTKHVHFRACYTKHMTRDKIVQLASDCPFNRAFYALFCKLN